VGEIWNGTIEAFRLIFTGDSEVGGIVWLSLRVTGAALVFASIVGIPLGLFLGLKRFLGRRIVVAMLYTGMGFPPVVVGLFVYLFVSRSGPMGSLAWLFTPKAMILAQSIISFPLVAGFTMAAVMAVPQEFRQQVRSLGANQYQIVWAILKEARVGVLISIIAGFGSIISEVGAVMIVGGNIEGSTRVLTTAIVLEVRKGVYDLAIALSIILLAISFIVNVAMLRLQGKAFD
jgi:tungstate transport system permease protein